MPINREQKEELVGNIKGWQDEGLSPDEIKEKTQYEVDVYEGKPQGTVTEDANAVPSTDSASQSSDGISDSDVLGNYTKFLTIKEAATPSDEDLSNLNSKSRSKTMSKFNKADSYDDDLKPLFLGDQYENYIKWKSTGQFDPDSDILDAEADKLRSKRINDIIDDNPDLQTDDFKQFLSKHKSELRGDSDQRVEQITKLTTDIVTSKNVLADLQTEIDDRKKSGGLITSGQAKTRHQLGLLINEKADEVFDINDGLYESLIESREFDALTDDIKRDFSAWGRLRNTVGGLVDDAQIQAYSAGQLLDSQYKTEPSFFDKGLERNLEEKKAGRDYKENYIERNIELGEIENISDLGEFLLEGSVDSIASTASLFVGIGLTASIAPTGGATSGIAAAYWAAYLPTLAGLAAVTKTGELALEDFEAKEKIRNLDTQINNSIGAAKAALIKEKKYQESVLDRSFAAKAGSVITEAASEVIFARFLGNYNAFSKLTKQLTSKVIKKTGGSVANELSKQWVKKTVKNIGKGAKIGLEEGVEESLTQVTQNIGDNVWLRKPVPIFEGVPEAFIHGTFLGLIGGGASVGVQSYVLKPYYEKEVRKSIADIANEIGKNNAELRNPNISEEIKNGLREKVGGLQKKLAGVGELIKDNAVNHTAQEIIDISAIQADKQKVAKELVEILDSNLSEEAKASVIAEKDTILAQLEQNIDSVLNRELSEGQRTQLTSPSNFNVNTFKETKEQLGNAKKTSEKQLAEYRKLAKSDGITTDKFDNNIAIIKDRVDRINADIKTVDGIIEKKNKEQEAEGTTSTPKPKDIKAKKSANDKAARIKKVLEGKVKTTKEVKVEKKEGNKIREEERGTGPKATKPFKKKADGEQILPTRRKQIKDTISGKLSPDTTKDADAVTKAESEIEDRKTLGKDTNRQEKRLKKLKKKVEAKSKTNEKVETIADNVIDTIETKSTAATKKLAKSISTKEDALEITKHIAENLDDLESTKIFEGLEDEIKDRSDISDNIKSDLINTLHKVNPKLREISDIKDQILALGKLKSKEAFKLMESLAFDLEALRINADINSIIENSLKELGIDKLGDFSGERDILFEKFKEKFKIDYEKKLEEASPIYDEALKNTSRRLDDMDTTTIQGEAVSSIPPQLILDLFGQAYVGSITEDLQSIGESADQIDLRFGREIFNYLKSTVADETILNDLLKPPAKLTQFLKEYGFNKRDALQRAENEAFKALGATASTLFTGSDGFLTNDFGIASKRTGLDIKINDIQALDNSGIKLELDRMQQNGVISISKGWADFKKNDGYFQFTIKDREAFAKWDKGDGVNGSRILWALNNKGQIHIQDKYWGKNSPISYFVNDKEKLNKLLFALTAYKGDTSTNTSLIKQPQPLPANIVNGKLKTSITNDGKDQGLPGISNVSSSLLNNILGKEGKPLKVLKKAGGVGYMFTEDSQYIHAVLEEQLASLDEYDEAQVQVLEDENIGHKEAKKLSAHFARVKEAKENQRDNEIYAMFLQGNKEFFSPTFADFRFRLYSALKDLNYINSKRIRGAISFSKPKALDTLGASLILMQLPDYYGGEFTRPESSGGQVLEHTKLVSDYERARIGAEMIPMALQIALNPKSKKTQDILAKASDPRMLVKTAVEVLQMARSLNDGKDITEHESTTPIGVDQTSSGGQHYAMATQDTKSGELVNVTDAIIKRDLYIAVGQYTKSFTNPDYQEPGENQWAKHKERLAELTADLSAAWKQDDIREAKKAIQTYALNEGEPLARMFWSHPDRLNDIRSLAKGPVMTRFYSAGAYTMAEKLVTKYRIKKGFERIDQSLAIWLTDHMVAGTKEVAPGVDLGRKTLIDIAKTIYDVTGAGFSTKGKLNDVPVHFDNTFLADKTEELFGNKEENRVYYDNPEGNSEKFDGDTWRHLNLTVKDISSKDLGTSVPPNWIHSLDAQIVSAIYLQDDFQALTIHDAFFTHAVDIKNMQQFVLDKMAELHSGNSMENMINNTFNGVYKSGHPLYTKLQQAKKVLLATYRRNRQALQYEVNGNKVTIPTLDPKEVKGAHNGNTSAAGSDAYGGRNLDILKKDDEVDLALKSSTEKAVAAENSKSLIEIRHCKI